MDTGRRLPCHAARQRRPAESRGPHDGVAAGPDLRRLSYAKRFTWLCRLARPLPRSGSCGQQVAMAADVHGWAAITDALWAPTVLPISLGVAL